MPQKGILKQNEMQIIVKLGKGLVLKFLGSCVQNYVCCLLGGGGGCPVTLVETCKVKLLKAG